MTRAGRLTSSFAAAILFSVAPALADAPAANDPRPTTVTLHVHDGSFAETVAALAKQAGMQISVYGDPVPGGEWPHVTIDADNKPFWEVICDVADQAHAEVAPNRSYGTTSNAIILDAVGTAGRTGVRVAGGPVLASFSQIVHLNQLTALPEKADFCEIDVNVMWEPRLAVAYSLSSGRPTTATDENGRSLVPADDAAADVDPRQGSNYRQYGKYTVPQTIHWNGPDGDKTQVENSVQYSLRLAVPPTAGRRIVDLKGQLSVWVAGPSERAEIDDLAESGNAKSKFYPLGPTVDLRVTNLTVQDSMVQAQLAVTRGRLSPEAWEQARVLLQSSLRMRVLDSDGKEWGHLQQGQSGSNFNADTLSLYPYVQHIGGGAGKPVKLVLECPVTATEVDVPYELRDLPLP